ncbi:MAG: hypothetical protein HUJ31_05570, partial [Pseudomonadales bacterium]|nr:hypothetical protein [Pseudomonadales bacterium]
VLDGFGGTTTGFADVILAGVDNIYLGGGSYDNNVNWSAGFVPGLGDSVLIDSTGTTVTVSTLGNQLGLLELDNSATFHIGFTGTSTTTTFTVDNLVMGPGTQIGVNGGFSLLEVTGNARLDTTSFFTRSGLSGFANGIVEFSGAGANINLPR